MVDLGHDLGFWSDSSLYNTYGKSVGFYLVKPKVKYSLNKVMLKNISKRKIQYSVLFFASYNLLLY